LEEKSSARRNLREKTRPPNWILPDKDPKIGFFGAKLSTFTGEKLKNQAGALPRLSLGVAVCPPEVRVDGTLLGGFPV
jgi:hypothetical protein